MYRTSKDSMEQRQRKKLSGSKSWYRKRKRNDDDEGPMVNGKESGSREGMRRNNNKRKVEDNSQEGKEGNNLKTRSVLFVDYSMDSQLVRKVKETLSRLEGIIGSKVKAVERCGLPLARQFPLTRLWDGMQCGRKDCVTCYQKEKKYTPATGGASRTRIFVWYATLEGEGRKPN